MRNQLERYCFLQPQISCSSALSRRSTRRASERLPHKKQAAPPISSVARDGILRPRPNSLNHVTIGIISHELCECRLIKRRHVHHGTHTCGRSGRSLCALPRPIWALSKSNIISERTDRHRLAQKALLVLSLELVVAQGRRRILGANLSAGPINLTLGTTHLVITYHHFFFSFLEQINLVSSPHTHAAQEFFCRIGTQRERRLCLGNLVVLTTCTPY